MSSKGSLLFGWIAVLVSLSGCANGGDASGDPATYIATWTYSHDETTSNCADVETGLFWRAGQLIVSAATTGQGLVASDRDGCTATFSIDGSTASLAPSGQSCTTPAGDTLQLEAWSLYLYDQNTLWPKRTVTRTDSTGAACQVTVVAYATD
jgi:hypothetical protein